MSDLVMQLKRVKKYFPLQRGFLQKRSLPVRAVDGIDLDIVRGEHLGLVGESGSGKTTLGRLMMRLYDSDQGQILLDGVDLAALDQKEIRPYRQKIQMIFQDPTNSLDPRWTIQGILEEPLKIVSSLDVKSKRLDQMKNILKTVGLPEDSLGRYPHEFSGGERQRIAIARALLMKPEVLLLDEAVSSLDVLIQKQILELLKTLAAEFSVTYIFISHNLKAVKEICPRVAVMYQGRIVELGPTESVMANPLHPYTQSLLAAAVEYRTSGDDQHYSISENSQLIDQGNGHFVIN